MRRVLNVDEAVAWREELGRQGRRVVFTNGVFDILHPGHVRYLARSPPPWRRPDFVAVNSDRSVRANKGPERPVHPEAERAEVITALPSSMPQSSSTKTRPTPSSAPSSPTSRQGRDWPADQIVGRDIVEARGGVVIRVPVEEGHSTTGVLRKLRQQN